MGMHLHAGKTGDNGVHALYLVVALEPRLGPNLALLHQLEVWLAQKNLPRSKVLQVMLQLELLLHIPLVVKPRRLPRLEMMVLLPLVAWRCKPELPSRSRSNSMMTTQRTWLLVTLVDLPLTSR